MNDPQSQLPAVAEKTIYHCEDATVEHHPQMTALMHGWSGLFIAYLTVCAAMCVGLARAHGRFKQYFVVSWMSVVILVALALFNAVLDFVLEHLGVSSGGFLETAVAFVMFIVVGYRCGAGLDAEPEDEHSHRRGALVSSEFFPSKKRRSRGNPREGQSGPGDSSSPVTLAGLAIPLQDEVKHFKFIGTTGTGKSTGISELLNAALARGDRAIIADPDGGYLNRFYDASRGDVILNPFEPDSVKWSLLEEITQEYDVDQLARSLIPEGSGSDKTWSDYARTFFIAVVRRTLEAGIKDDGEVFRLITKASTDELKLLAKGTIAGPFLEDGNEKMFGSLRSVTAAAVRGLDYTTKGRGAPFSVRRWVRDGASRRGGGGGGVLFLPYKAGEIAALKSTISAWLRIAIFEAMSRPEGDHRLWFIVDELDALGEIDGLKDALTRLRKFGGRCVLGFQSISQVSGTYGKGTADTIVENCTNTLILRCSASETGGTSQFASRLIGQREVVYQTHSTTRQPGRWSASRTTSEHRAVEHAIMASEIERLSDLQGYLKLASDPDWYRVALSRVEYRATPRPPRREAEAGPHASYAATERQPVQPAPVVPAAASPQAAPVRARKSRVTGAKRPRKSPVKAAESHGVGEMPGVGGERHEVAVEGGSERPAARANPAPRSLE